jgi:hypothetical protein
MYTLITRDKGNMHSRVIYQYRGEWGNHELDKRVPEWSVSVSATIGRICIA